jgi:hypothetical protein
MNSNLPAPPNDGDGFSRSLPGDRLTKGQIAKWDAEKKWHDRDGLSLPTRMFVMGVDTALQRWKDQRPETILDKPQPDPAELNKTIPIGEWELDMSGRPRPPWEKVYAVYLVDLTTGTLYTYVSGTAGARICYEQLQESVCIMRALRGAKVLPLVNLDQRPMKTQFGMKSRPHLQIIDWRAPGDSGLGPLPPPSSPQLPGPTTAGAPTPNSAPAAATASAPASSAAPPMASARSCHPQRDATSQARHHGGVRRRRNAAMGLSRPVKTHN